MQQRDHLDAAIDGVARAMTAAAPSKELREAVARRIAGPASLAGSWRSWSMAALAAALVVTAVAMWRERPMETSPSRLAAEHAPAAQPTLPPAVPPDETRRAALGDRVSVTSAGRPGRRAAARQTVTAATNDAVLIRPLAIDPIGSGAAEVDTMSVPARVAIDPIAVTPMRIFDVGQQVE
jgi:hypothetical protein